MITVQGGQGDLTDEQWAVLEALLPRGARAGRPPVWPRRQREGTRQRIFTRLQALSDAKGAITWDLRVRVPRIGSGRPRVRPDRVRTDKAYACRRNRAYLRRRGIRCTIPDKVDQAHSRRRRGFRGGRPPRT